MELAEIAEDEVTDAVPECPARARAMETIERVDDLIAAPRYGVESAAEYERTYRERAEPIVTKRAEPAATVRKVTLQPPAPPVRRAAFDGDALGDQIVEVVKSYVARQQAPLIARIVDLESRLARAESRVADVERKRGKK